MNTETKTPTDAGDGNAVADVKAVATEVAKEAFKETAKAQHSKTEADSTRNTNPCDISSTTSPRSQTQTQAVPSNNDAISEVLQHDLTSEKKREVINLFTENNVPEDAKPTAAVTAEVKQDTEVIQPVEQKKSIFEQQGFEYHEMSAEDQELGFTRFRWLTDEEAVEAEKEMADAEKARKKAKVDGKKARADRLNKAEKKALLNAQIEPRKLDVFKENGVPKTPVERASLPPTVEDATEICSKCSVEEATKSLIANMQTLDIATHMVLPVTPQAESNKILKITSPSPMDEISNDDEELPPRPPKLEKHVSFENDAPYKTSESLRGDKIQSFAGASDDNVDFLYQEPEKCGQAYHFF